MIRTSLFTSTLFGVLTLVQAFPVVPRDSNAWFSGFIRALDGAGLTRTSNVLMDFCVTDPGQKYLEMLQTQPCVFLAPGNDAYESDHPSIEGDLFTYFTYNTLVGALPSTKRQEAPAQSRDIVQTLMSKPTFSKRAGGDNQVQVVDTVKDNGATDILIRATTKSAKVLTPTTYQGVTIWPINTDLVIPTKIDNVLTKPLVDQAPEGFNNLTQGLQATGLMDTVNNGNGITLLAPIDYAFEGYDWISKDDLAPILKNHVYSSPYFSPSLNSDFSATTLSDQKLKFTNEGGTTYVSCGYTKATVLRSDVVTANGVVHVIDKLLARCN
ncbi:FAS1 domain-containing protein [Ceratobasidium sp. AG-I]|nr:FAS1 domain-containing protein [Ceratobasidium sp. AG-I]